MISWLTFPLRVRNHSVFDFIRIELFLRLLITGICGFVGSTLASSIRERGLRWEIVGLDNLIRPGSEENRRSLKHLGVQFHHGDIRCASDFEPLPRCDWILDAAANPSVLAGIDGQTSSRQLIEHNLLGTVNLLEYAKQWKAGFILLSTSRVYSIPPLAALPVEDQGGAYVPIATSDMPIGVSSLGISEQYSVAPPVSLYGATKLASEVLALEYASTFDLPCWVNRCGVLAGSGQFGRPDQGIFAFWIHSHRAKRPLKYIGFNGNGHQVRDCLHPRDLVSLLEKQVEADAKSKTRIVNVSGGIESAMSLRKLTSWCDEKFGTHSVASDSVGRRFDLPWVVLDSSQAASVWDWRPQMPVAEILDEIAVQADSRPDWLDITGL